MDELKVFSDDAGMSSTKFAGPDGRLLFLSQVASDGGHPVARMMGLGATQPPLLVTTNAGSFYVGPGAHDWGRPIESLDYERLTGTPEMIALFYGSFTQYMQRYGQLRTPVSITVGMPLEMVSGDESAVASNIEAVRRWMKGAHTWTADDVPYQMDVADVKVTSQTAGALFDYLLDDEGKFLPESRVAFKGEVGVASIGFNTVEIQAVRDRKTVQKWTVGVTAGERRLLEMVNAQRLYSLGELDARLRAGDLDLSRMLPVWEREVVGAIEGRWGNQWRRFSVVLMVGGGAVLLRDSLPHRFGGKAFVPSDPVMSIASGLRKLSLLNRPKKKGPSQPVADETQAALG